MTSCLLSCTPSFLKGKNLLPKVFPFKGSPFSEGQALVSHLDGRPTGDQEVADLIMKYMYVYFLQSFSPFC